MKYVFYSVTVIAAIILFTVHMVADQNSLYFKIWWLDIPMHLWGGVCVALAALATYQVYPRTVDQLSLWIGVVLAVLVVGAFWELYEIALNNLYHIDRFDLIDMISDLINDTLGALAALFVSKKLHWYAK